MRKIKPYLAFQNYNLALALKVMQKNGQRRCVVVDKSYRLLGTLSADDVRKFISKKSNLKRINIKRLINKSFFDLN